MQLPSNLNNFYGTKKDWNQTLIPIINLLKREGKDRVLYGKKLNECGINNVNITLDCLREAHIICHPDRKNLILSLDSHINFMDIIFFKDYSINVQFDENIDPLKIKYVEGLYENEIQLIDAAYPFSEQVNLID